MVDLERAQRLGLICDNPDCTNFKNDRKLCNACYLRQYRDKPQTKRDYKNRWLQRLYGITIEDFEAMLEDQDFECAICSKEIHLYGNKTNVDHCHQTGKVRGLLCSSCNSLIALAKESEEVLLNAISYLKR